MRSLIITIFILSISITHGLESYDGSDLPPSRRDETPENYGTHDSYSAQALAFVERERNAGQQQTNMQIESSMEAGAQSLYNNCYDANWWGSFDWTGWSWCHEKYLITGFWRNAWSFDRDYIFLLESAKCCAGDYSELEYLQVSLPQGEGWWNCPEGFFFGALYRTGAIWDPNGNSLANVALMQCRRPRSRPRKWGECVELDTSSTWGQISQGWTTCPDGYYLTGMYRSDCTALRCLPRWRCCQISPPLCSVNSGGCDKMTTCTNTDDGKQCGPCPSGYIGSGESGCKDVDECRTNNGGCDKLTDCINTPGSRTCGTCPNGYKMQPGDTPCVDINECADSNGGCDPLTACTNTFGSRKCSDCPAGFSGNGATPCVDIDECTMNNGGCDLITRCTNTVGSRKCGNCPSGFSGNGETKCKDVDECMENNGGCDPLTQCKNTRGSRECSACPKGFVGKGDTGCRDVDECMTNNGGCDRLTTCTNTPGSLQCGTCPSGYTGDGYTGCQDVDECRLRNGECHALAKCTNTPGSRLCGPCAPGYEGDGLRCSDVDECVRNNGDCDPLVSCVNTPGSRECGECPKGYQGNGAVKCLDVDECSMIPNGGCDPQVTCTNTPGSRICSECPPGTKGTGYTRCVNDTSYIDDLVRPAKIRITDDEVDAQIGREVGQVYAEYNKMAELYSDDIGVTPTTVTDEQSTKIANDVATAIITEFAAKAAAANAAPPPASNGYGYGYGGSSGGADQSSNSVRGGGGAGAPSSGSPLSSEGSSAVTSDPIKREGGSALTNTPGSPVQI